MTAVAEPKKKNKKPGVSDNTIAAVARLDHPEYDDLSDQEVVALVDKQNGISEDKALPAKPGEPGFDWQALYPGEKVFVHTHDGITVGLAAISEKRQPSIGFLRAARKQPEFEQVLDMVEFISCPEALALVDAWVPTDLIAVFEKWSEWNRTAAGE